MIVVSDTSPILNLGRIGRLQLLPSLYQSVLIPSAVYEELKSFEDDMAQPIDLSANSWLAVATAKNRHHVHKLREHLDPGEAEAIVLALEHKADLLLVDERRARRTARDSGLAVTGLMGIIAKAKRDGLIDLAKPVLDELIYIARFWVGPELYAAVLVELGEFEGGPR